MSTPPRSPTRHALVIGIDDYPRLQPLKGCVNDALMFCRILEEKFGFPKENITQLLNGEATREGILSALDALVERVGTDDAVVIQYAGHGSQMTDREGDEPDGLDETIMPFDSEGWQGDNRDITDDEIHLRLLRLAEKTSNTTLVIDACHSGTITRDAFGALSRSQPPDTRPVEELPPSPIPPEMHAVVRSRGPSGWMPLDRHYVLMAGCRDEEVSYEYAVRSGDEWIMHGAMTYFLCQELTRAQAGATYRDVFERVAARVNANNGRQHPQMEGRIDREIFGVRDLPPMTFARVTARDGEKVTLGVGVAHGATVGSEFTVYPQGTRTAEGAVPLGRVELIRVGAVTAEARVVDEDEPGVIDVGTRAVETSHAHGGFRLAVEVVDRCGDPGAVAALVAALQTSEHLDLGQPEAAAVCVYALPTRTSADRDDPVPQLGALPEPAFVAVDGSGGLVMWPKPLQDVDTVRENLEKIARYRRLLMLDNPSPVNSMAGQFTVEILRKDGGGAWVAAEPEEAGGLVVFEEGDELDVRISSRWSKPVFVTVLDFDLHGAIEQIHPATGASDTLDPQQTFMVGRGDSFEATIPDDVPPDFTEGVETVKVFLTTEQADLSGLSQEGMRAGDAPPETALGALLRAASEGGGTRGMVRKVSAEWLTITRPFVVRRRSADRLEPGGVSLSPGGISVTSTGVSAKVTAVPGLSGRVEAAAQGTDILSRAFDAAEVSVSQTVALHDIQSLERGAGPAGLDPGGPAREPELEFAVPAPPPGMEQVVLASDEVGVLSWHFPVEDPGALTREGPGDSRTYRVPVGQTTRGLAGIAGTAALRILVFPALRAAAGAAADALALQVETRRNPYRIRSFTPDDFGSADAPGLTPGDWRRIGSGPALLMVHGTFSTAHDAFGGLPRAVVEELHRRYDGRVFAFNHPTLSVDPVDNVDWFLQQVPEGISLDLDLICHSRGGIVGRVMTELADRFAPRDAGLRVGKVVFVGSPNGGTGLADGKQWLNLLNTYTNLLYRVELVDSLAIVVDFLKHLASGIGVRLPGLRSMVPGGEFLSELNARRGGAKARYYALASDYEPANPIFRRLVDLELDRGVLGGPNDLVVPAASVWDRNGADAFPVEERVVFEGSSAMSHVAYFSDPEVQAHLLRWLDGEAR